MLLQPVLGHLQPTSANKPLSGAELSALARPRLIPGFDLLIKSAFQQYRDNPLIFMYDAANSYNSVRFLTSKPHSLTTGALGE